MASAAALGPYSRASALISKSYELRLRGHLERSDNKLREALTSARAVGTEDCLVTAFLTVRVAERDLRSLARRFFEPQVASPNRTSFTAKLRELAEVMTSAAAVARRRRFAGTHQSAEQAWYKAYYAADLRAQGCTEGNAEATAHLASLASDTTVLAACEALFALEAAAKLALFSASELSGRLAQACDLVDEAVALAGPQRLKDTYSGYEAVMKGYLSAGIELWRQERSTAVHAARLAEALKQLSLHGTMTAEQQTQLDKEAKSHRAKMAASRAAASAPELLRSCELASCGAKEAHVKHFSRCSACKTVVYCSKNCQLADWPAHKKACKAARQAAEAAKTA